MSSADDRSAWGSAPWTPTTSPETQTTVGWQKHVAYIPESTNSLQTLTAWVPATSDRSPPDDASLPRRPGRWIIFIHGGAWRDPAVTAAAFDRAAAALLLRNQDSTSTSKGSRIAGLASLNYRLSPYPGRPSDDPAYKAQHPDHIGDVLSGLAFLQRLGAATGDYVLAGHSCGATLAFQAVMDPARWGLGIAVRKPALVVGLNGLYDLAGFVKRPPGGYEGLRDAYEEFTRGAFGGDEEVWKAVCPATAEGWVGEWKGSSRGVVLVQSGEDTLVPREQLEGMKACLESGGVKVREMEAGGGHDEMWERGEGRMTEILWGVVLGLE